jgi:hypothetical protein
MDCDTVFDFMFLISVQELPEQRNANVLSHSSGGRRLNVVGDALRALYNGTAGANWISKSGWLNSSTSVCGWFGVVCDNGDNVVSPKGIGMEGELLSPYAVTKRLNEEYGKVYHKLHKMETIGLRYFNVFGPKQDPNGVYAAAIPKFIDKIICLIFYFIIF